MSKLEWFILALIIIGGPALLGYWDIAAAGAAVLLAWWFYRLNEKDN